MDSSQNSKFLNIEQFKQQLIIEKNNKQKLSKSINSFLKSFYSQFRLLYLKKRSLIDGFMDIKENRTKLLKSIYILFKKRKQTLSKEQLKVIGKMVNDSFKYANQEQQFFKEISKKEQEDILLQMTPLLNKLKEIFKEEFTQKDTIIFDCKLKPLHVYFNTQYIQISFKVNNQVVDYKLSFLDSKCLSNGQPMKVVDMVSFSLMMQAFETYLRKGEMELRL